MKTLANEFLSEALSDSEKVDAGNKMVDEIEKNSDKKYSDEERAELVKKFVDNMKSGDDSSSIVDEFQEGKTKEEMESLVEILAKFGDDIEYAYRNYSGRGMAGKKCFGVVVSPYAKRFRAALDDADLSPEVDSLGRDHIYYWQDIKSDQIENILPSALQFDESIEDFSDDELEKSKLVTILDMAFKKMGTKPKDFQLEKLQALVIVLGGMLDDTPMKGKAARLVKQMVVKNFKEGCEDPEEIELTDTEEDDNSGDLSVQELEKKEVECADALAKVRSALNYAREQEESSKK